MKHSSSCNAALIFLAFAAQWPIAASFGAPGFSSTYAIAVCCSTAAVVACWYFQRGQPRPALIFLVVLLIVAADFLAFRRAAIQIFELHAGASFLAGGIYLLGRGARRGAAVAVCATTMSVMMALLDSVGPTLMTPFSTLQQGRFLVEDSIYWARNIPDSTCRFQCFQADGTAEFDAIYHIDQDETRAVPDRPATGRRMAIFGGSFAFGEGVSDSETVAALLQRSNPSLRVFNHAVRGFGTAEVYIQLRQRVSTDESVAECLYFLIPDHFRRTSCPDELTASTMGAGKPRFNLAGDKLHYLGRAEETLGTLRGLHVNLLRRSWLWRLATPRWSRTADDEGLVAVMVKGMAATCDTLPHCRFHLVLLLQQSEAQAGAVEDLAPWCQNLEASGLRVLDLRPRFLEFMRQRNQSAKDLFFIEGHPRPLYYRLTAEWTQAFLAK